MLASYDPLTGALMLTPQEGFRSPLRVVIAVDISSSMHVTSREGHPELGIYSRLDIAKFSALVLAHGTQPDSEVAVVAYDDIAYLAHDFVAGGSASVEDLDAAVRGLSSRGATNIGRAVQFCVNLLDRRRESAPRENVTEAILLLTDGANTSGPDPLRTVTNEWTRRRAAGLVAPCLFTIGLSYAKKRRDGMTPDHVMLQRMACETGGSYTFVSDGSMVATSLIHAQAALETLSGHDVRVTWRDAWSSDDGDEHSANLGIVAGGDTRVYMLDSDAENVTVTYCIGGLMHGVKASVAARADIPPAAVDRARLVQQFLALFPRLSVRASPAPGTFDTLTAACADGDENADGDFRRALLQDIYRKEDGSPAECRAAIDNWSSWGAPHVLSLFEAFRTRRRHQFKDHSVQLFGSEAFVRAVESSDRVFASMTPVRASLFEKVRDALPPEQRENFKEDPENANDKNSGCLSGDARVLTSNGAERIDCLRRGMVLRSGARVRTVLCIKGNAAPMVRLPGGGGAITLWHPLRRGNTSSDWFFPHDAGMERVPDTPTTVYNVMLEPEDRNMRMTLCCGWDVATLGHSLKGPVIGHAYYGSDRVRRDVDALAADEDGLATVNASDMTTRRGSDGTVVSVEYA